MLEGKGPVALLEAYFDESERAGGVFCVAGYAFAPPQARKFVKEWARLFDGYVGGFHMVDFVHRRGAFKGLAVTEQGPLLREAVKIINRRMAFGVAVSCNLAEVELRSPRWMRGFGHAYPVCCHLCMMALGSLIGDANLRGDVTYVFEAGHPSEPEARDFMKGATESPDLKRSYRHRGDSFLPKSDAVPLQAADLLAWEWAKCRDETLEQGIRPLRKSLRALFESAPKRYKIAHITGEPLVRFMTAVRDLGLLQLQEEADGGANNESVQ